MVMLLNRTVLEIAGVVADVPLGDLDTPIRPTMYMTFAQDPSNSSYVVIKTSLDLDAMGGAVRGQVQRLGPDLP
jgi:hypothetical protein